jgi:hypothetical protein
VGMCFCSVSKWDWYLLVVANLYVTLVNGRICVCADSRIFDKIEFSLQEHSVGAHFFFN